MNRVKYPFPKCIGVFLLFLTFSKFSAQCNFFVNVTNDPLFCIGSSTSATVTPLNGSLGTPPYTYTWSPAVSAGSTANGLGPGVYNISVTDFNGCVASTQLVIVSASSPTITFAVTDVQCFGAANGSVVANAFNGIAPYTYTWTGLGINTTSLSNLAPGVYTLQATDNTGCPFSNTVSITQPSSLTAAFNSPTITCPNGKTTATVVLSGGTAPYTQTTTPGNLTAVNLASLSAGIYTTQIRDANACLLTVTNTIVQPPSFLANYVKTPETCDGNKNGGIVANVSGGTPAYTYSWSVTPAQTSATLNNIGAGNYSLQVKDANNCNFTFTTNLTLLNGFGVLINSTRPISCFGACNGSISAQETGGIPPFTYQWQGPISSTLSSITNLCAGNYTIGITDNTGCTTYQQINLINPPAIGAGILGNTLTCVNNPVTLTASINGGTPPFTYAWVPAAANQSVISVTPSVTTTYSVNITDNNGCLTRASNTLQVRSALTVSVPVNNTGLCLGAELTINPVVAGGDGNYTYQWLPLGVTTSSINLKNLNVPNFTLVVRDGCNSPAAVRVITLTIFPKTKVNFESVWQMGCEPFCTQFDNNTPKSSNEIWTFGDGPNQQTGSNASYCYKTNGSFDVNLSLVDSNGCKQDFTKKNYITVLKKPAIGFSFSNANPTFYEPEVSFNNTTDFALAYEWWLDKKLVSNQKDLNYIFDDTRCYNITLIAINDCGCSDSLTQNICVSDGFNFYVPDHFSPNDDDLNEVFIPKGTGWNKNAYSFEVFSRWGFSIFKTNDVAQGWDGSYKGALVKPDVFIWKAQLQDEFGKEYNYSGTITVIR